jgi:hypothetical protein
MVKHDIEEIRQGLRDGAFQSEAAVTQGIVIRLLQSLGWPQFDPRVVTHQYVLNGRRVDLALCHPPNKARILIEVKKVGQGTGAERQLFEYAFHAGVPLVVLTDGAEWNFFVPAGLGDYSERSVYKLDLVEREVEESVRRLERYLRFDSVCSGAALSAAQVDYQDIARAREISQTLPRAWLKLADDGYDLLLELLAERTESLCGYKPDLDTVTRFLADNIQLVTALAHPPPRPTLQAAAQVSASIAGGSLPATGFFLQGEFSACRNAREVMTSVIERLADQDPTFLEKFVSLPRHGRTRRYVAINRSELYPDRPDLAQEYSHQLRSGYWLGTNYSRRQIEQILEMACDVARVRYGTDLKLNLGT